MISHFIDIFPKSYMYPKINRTHISKGQDFHLYISFSDDEMGMGSIQRHSYNFYNILPGSQTVCIFKTSVTFNCFNIKINFTVKFLPASRDQPVLFQIFLQFSNLD